MSRILLIGHVPPPYSPNTKVEAANYRTWQFIQPLLEDGHRISLCIPHQRGQQIEAGPHPAGDSLKIYEFPFDRPGWVSRLQDVLRSDDPDCIVAVNFDACLYATKLRTRKPVWMDIYGDYMTIVQAARYRARSDRGIPTSIFFQQQALSRGDRFSVCSKAQSHMLVGELAMAGRLNWRTFGYSFVDVVLPGSPPADEPVENTRGRRTVLNSIGINQDDFVVLWCGGYNTWTDVTTLFRGLEMAMSQDPTIHFVSIGEATYDAPDSTYSQLQSLIEKSSSRGRYHMLGWRPWKQIGEYYIESSVGINIDALHYETIYGTRTRLLEMMATGLPVITSLGSEISYLVKDAGAGMGFEIGDWRQLGLNMLTLAKDRGLHGQISRSAIGLTRNQLSFRTTTANLREWVANPHHAPDRQDVGPKDRLIYLQHRIRALSRQLIWRLVGLYR